MTSKFMDSRTLRLLEFPKVRDFLSGFAVSEGGRDRCRDLVPLGSEIEVRRENEILRQLLAWASERTVHVAEFPPLDLIWGTVDRPERFLEADGLFTVKLVLDQIRQVRQELGSLDETRFPDLQARLSRCAWPETLWAGLKRCLNDEGAITDESSPELYAIRQELRAIHTRCRKKVTEFVQARSMEEYLQDEYLTISSDRYVLALKSNFKGRIKGIVHDYSQTGETCYFEPFFLIDLNNQLRGLKQEERDAEEKVLRYLTDLIRQERDELAQAYVWLVDFDFLLAKVKMSRTIDGIPLNIDSGSALNLRDARHPVLAFSSHRVQPLNIELKNGQHGLIVSGGNAGGKTVCLKTLGLTALMALCGLPVPAGEGSSMPFFSSLFVFIGDEQSLEDHVSTYTAQIRHLAEYWPRISQNSLVILDEFGAGTDPSQGAALAQAVIDKLMEKQALVIAATHFPALKAYGMTREGVRSASVLFDPDTKKPLYTLAYDQVGMSLALDVAREHGLPMDVLDQARRYLLLDGEDSGRLMDRLNELALQRERELEAFHREHRRELDRLAKERERLRQERERTLQELRSYSQEIVREWKSGRQGRKQALSKLARARKDAGPLQSHDAPSERVLEFDELDRGMQVFYPAMSRKGTVADKDERKRQVKLDFGGVSLWASPQELTKAAGGIETKGFHANFAAAPEASTLRLDLRGLRAEEAIAKLARFLDQAMLKGMTNLEIIHGKGTGTLRREVHEFLKGHPGTTSHGLAPEDQGGDGVTLVELD